MTHDELTRAERLGNQMVSNTKQWIDGYQKYHLDDVTRILSEVQHAGIFLCDPTTSPELREEVLKRLGASLFTVTPVPVAVTCAT